MRRHLLLPVVVLFLLGAAKEEPVTDGDLLTTALTRIDELYLHPGAIDPEEMLRAGIQRLEHQSPDVLVLSDAEQRLTVRSAGRERSFDVAGVDDLVEVRAQLGTAIDFVLEGRDPEDLDRDDLEVASLRGMLHTIDRHSRLIVGDGLDEFNTRFKGTLVGIGSRIGRRDNAQGVTVLQILGPFRGSPAERAGLLLGDEITHIDGHSTAGISVEDAVERIRGSEGVPVVLTVQRPGEAGRRIFAIVREKVRVPSVEAELLPGGVGYIVIDHFSQKTNVEVAEEMDALRAEAGALQGLVIDLRGNTGGSLRKAARIVEYFVDEGELVRTEGKDGGSVAKLTPRIAADGRHKRYEGPVAVLVNGRTASGSEIVAGGLKYLDRSITIGTQTFGKGTVQKVYPLRTEEGRKVSMKLTVARYLLPGEAFINTVGVTPDVMTGPIWLDPDEPVLPENLREPPGLTGRSAGAGGLDARKNPGGGRAPFTDGVNAAPVLSLWYPRVLDGWSDDAPQTPAEGSDPPAPEDDRPGWSDLAGDAGDLLFNDVELRLAHEVLLAAEPGDRRDELIERARPLVDEWRRLQADRMAAAAQGRSIAWSADPIPTWMDRAPGREDALQARMLEPPPADVDATLLLPDRFVAGEDASIRLEVRNRRDAPLRHLRARVESSTDILDGASFLIGDLAPGASNGWTVPVSVDPAYRTRADGWRLYLIDDDGPLGGPFTGTAETRGAELPSLSLLVRSRVEPQPDGSLLLYASVKVRNDGPGTTGEIQIHFGEPKVDDVERMERFDSIDDGLEPNAAEQVELRLRVRDPSATPLVPIRLRAKDKRSALATTLSLELPTEGTSDTGWRIPPVITMQRPRSERTAPADRGQAGYAVAGRVEARAGVASVEVSVGGDKVWSRQADEAVERQDFEAPAVLEVGPNRVRVEVETGDGVELSRTWWVLGEREPDAE
jgi:carboxyl-terminal processing protease